jgi:pimeloyl-ACP methyl ester carboxylesterase
MKTMTAIAAIAGALAFASAAPALAQAHGDHGQHPAPARTEAPEAGHGHAHADFESGRFHVRIDGPEHPVGDIILIPGLSSSPHAFDLLTEELKGRYRVHRIHIQGFAGAPAEDNATGNVSAPVAEDLARYIAEQGLNKPAVIGHSMGGTIGMMLAARHPDSLGRLMVVDMLPFIGAMFAAPGTNPTAEAVIPVADQIYAGMISSPEAQYRQQAAAAVTGMIRTEALRAGPLEDTARSDRAVSSAAYRELLVTDLRSELSRITAPTTVLYVAFDFPGMTPEMTDGIYGGSFANLPGATLTRIDDSAHFIMLDQPARFTAEVNAFLE